MKRYERYLASELIGGALVALAILGSLEFSALLLEGVGDLGAEAVDLFQWVLLPILQLPQRLYDLYPTAVLLGGVVTLSAVAARNELVVIRAAGASHAVLVRATLIAGALLALFAVTLGEWVVPQAERMTLSLSERGASRGSEGVWARDGQRFIYARERLGDDTLRHVVLYELDPEGALTRVIEADAALYYHSSSDQNRGGWRLLDVRETAIGERGIQRRRAEEEFWRSALTPRLLDSQAVEVRALTMSSLYRHLRYLKANDIDASEIEHAFWNKAVTPIAPMVLLYAILPFAIGRLRSSRSASRLVIGILIGLAFFFMTRLSARIGWVYGYPGFWSATLPLLVVLAIGSVGLWRSR